MGETGKETVFQWRIENVKKCRDRLSGDSADPVQWTGRWLAPGDDLPLLTATLTGADSGRLAVTETLVRCLDRVQWTADGRWSAAVPWHAAGPAAGRCNDDGDEVCTVVPWHQRHWTNASPSRRQLQQHSHQTGLTRHTRPGPTRTLFTMTTSWSSATLSHQTVD